MTVVARLTSDGSSHTATASSSHMGNDWPHLPRYASNGAVPCPTCLMYSGLKNVRVVGSTGICVILRQGSCSTMEAASASQCMLNSSRGAFTYSAENALPAGTGLKLPPMNTSSFASEANLGSSRAAMATLLNGPSSRMVTSPGYLWTMRIMKLTADSSAARIVGAPSASGGTKNGSA